MAIDCAVSYCRGHIRKAMTVISESPRGSFGGSRTAAVHEAQATCDGAVATYRQTVLSAFQNVEDSLSSCNHLQEQANAFADIYHRNQQLFESEREQLLAGTASEQNLLTQQLTLLSAEQSLKDTQGLLIQSSVTLIRNLGGGWQWHETKQASVDPSVMPRHEMGTE